MEVRKVKCWIRSDISTCNCSEKQYGHVHCPCSDCKGRATDRRTELRHWNQTNVLIDHKRDESQLVAAGEEILFISQHEKNPILMFPVSVTFRNIFPFFLSNKIPRLGKIKHNDFPYLGTICFFLSTSQLFPISV